MKLLTINTHSIIEENYNEKCKIFADTINRIKPDIIAMQEVNQSKDSKIAFGYDKIKDDNHALKISNMLNGYHLSWLGVKIGYKIFEEGLAILSKEPVTDVSNLLLSDIYDYNNWKTRKAQIARIGNMIICNVHMGWWDDLEEPFSRQFDRLDKYLSNFSDTIFLMGDFNSPADEKGKGYDMVLSRGWFDTYSLAKNKDKGFTVTGEIAGWEENRDSKRIDYIFTNKKINVKSSKVIFNGENEEIISDHSGVIIEI